MTIFLAALGIVVGLGVLGLAGMGCWVLFGQPPPEDSGAVRLREAEQQIGEISRRTQEALIADALRRAQYDGGGPP